MFASKRGTACMPLDRASWHGSHPSRGHFGTSSSTAEDIASQRKPAGNGATFSNRWRRHCRARLDIFDV